MGNLLSSAQFEFHFSWSVILSVGPVLFHDRASSIWIIFTSKRTHAFRPVRNKHGWAILGKLVNELSFISVVQWICSLLGKLSPVIVGLKKTVKAENRERPLFDFRTWFRDRKVEHAATWGWGWGCGCEWHIALRPSLPWGLGKTGKGIRSLQKGLFFSLFSKKISVFLRQQHLWL